MTKRYAKAPSLFFDIPLALLPAKRDEIIAFWDVKLKGGALEWEGESAPTFEAQIVEQERSESGEVKEGSKIAVLPLYGVISQRMNMMTAMSGGTSTDLFAQEFLKVLHDPEIGAIIFDIDSPGGSTFGVTELSNLIMESRGQKPIVSFVSPLGASAAYWIASATDHIFAAPSALVGSIGVYTVHTDLSQAAENEGIKVTFIHAGKNKVRANEFEPLKDDDRRYLQSIVDDAYNMFVADVARGRRTNRTKVLKEYGEGDVFTTSKALEAGMIDGIRNNLGEVVAGLPELKPRKVVPRSLAADVTPSEALPVIDVAGTDVNSASPRDSHEWHFAGPIPPHSSSSIADDDAEWDANAEVGAAEGREELRRMHVWVDDEGDPDAKGSYKGPHHRANGELVPRGLFALAARENQMDIPDGDHAGVRRHMARHYRELDRTPPWEEEEQEARVRNWRLQQWRAQKDWAEAFSAPPTREEE